MSGTLTPVLRHRYFDSNGNPLAGGLLYSYQAGTTTAQATYTDSTLGTANTNPVVLDASGEADVWLDPTLSYKFTLKDSDGVTQWTVDNVQGALSPSAVATATIQDLAVTTAKLADDSVDSTKLKDDASTDANRAVTTNHIRDGAVTMAKRAALNYQASNSAYFTGTSASYDDVDDSDTNPISATIVTNGRPVFVGLSASSDAATGSQIYVSASNDAAFTLTIAILRDAAVVKEFVFRLTNTNVAPIIAIPPGGVWFMDLGLAAASYAYTMQVKISSTNSTASVILRDFKLVAIEF